MSILGGCVRKVVACRGQATGDLILIFFSWWPNPFASAHRKLMIIIFSGLIKERKNLRIYDDCFVSHQIFNTAFGIIHVRKLGSFVMLRGALQSGNETQASKQTSKNLHGKAISGNTSNTSPYTTSVEAISSFRSREIKSIVCQVVAYRTLKRLKTVNKHL